MPIYKVETFVNTESELGKPIQQLTDVETNVITYAMAVPMLVEQGGKPGFIEAPMELKAASLQEAFAISKDKFDEHIVKLEKLVRDVQGKKQLVTANSIPKFENIAKDLS